MYRLICQKPARFVSAQMALVSTFFQMFLVLGMYNYDPNLKIESWMDSNTYTTVLQQQHQQRQQQQPPGHAVCQFKTASHA